VFLGPLGAQRFHLRSGVASVPIVGVAAFVQLILRVLLWLVDSMWIGRNQPQRNTHAGHVPAS
jgi:hypothetical protein